MRRPVILAVAWLLTGPVAAAELAIVVDDLGYSLERAERVLALPVPVTLALLPFAPATREIAGRAAVTGHEIILHQPMEALATSRVTPLPGVLTADMSPESFEASLDSALAAVPGIVGINNHTGSRLTQDSAAMQQLMGYLAARGLMFLDSRTTPATVAYTIAREARVPAVERDVFLDHHPQRPDIEGEFRRALAIAGRQGYAVIIAHPYGTSLDFLEQALAVLPPEIEVVSLRRLADRDPATLARHESPASPHRSLGQ